MSTDVAEYAVDGIVPSEVVFPHSPEEVAERVRRAAEEKLAIVPWGGGTMMRLGGIPRAADIALCTTEMNRLLEYEPADLVVTIEAGMRLAALQRILGEHGQMLALDPPLPDQATIGGIIAANSSGPLRLRHGTCRDQLIGIKVVDAEGAITKSGGKVVKNVTGYDLGKLYTGSLGTLGIIVEASFKVAPVPAVESTIVASFGSVGAAWTAARSIRHSTLPIRGCEALRGEAIAAGGGDKPHPYAGTAARCDLSVWIGGGEAAVDRQRKDVLAMCSAAGGTQVLEGEEQRAYWRRIEDYGRKTAGIVAKISVVPSRTGELLELLPPGASVVSHALSGVTYVFDTDPAELAPLASSLGGYLVLEACPTEMKRRLHVWGEPGPDFPLMQRIKQQFDPQGMFNPGRYVGGI